MPARDPQTADQPPGDLVVAVALPRSVNVVRPGQSRLPIAGRPILNRTSASHQQEVDVTENDPRADPTNGIGEILTDADEKFADSDPRLAIGNYRYY
jgi:hypothetical protein